MKAVGYYFLTNLAVGGALLGWRSPDSVADYIVTLGASLVVSAVVLPSTVLWLNWIRAPFAVAGERRQSETYNLLSRAWTQARDLALRNITPGKEKADWLADVTTFRQFMERDVKPHLLPHQWAKVFGYHLIAPEPHIGHQIDDEHGQHLRHLNGMIDHLTSLMEEYATQPRAT